MKSSRRGLVMTGSLIFFLALTVGSSLSRAQGREVIFSVTGDVPYSSSETKTFKKQIEKHNKYSPSAFFVHVGDILSGSASCNESVYSEMEDILKDLAVPAYIVPGDNETVDCKSSSSGMNFFLKHFQGLEQNFCNAPVTERQSERPENWAFTLDGVLFIGIDLVYNAKSVEKQAAQWVEQQLEAKASEIRAAVVFAHFEPNSSSTFSKPFRSAAKAFGKPVLFVHGHGHSWSTSNPFPEKNIFRVQVNMGGSEDPVQVTVTMDMSSTAKAFLLKRKPFGKTTVTMPPCVDAGPDQTVASNLATLQGNTGNSTASFTTTWSQVSGPGAVTFGDANALMTTASFSAGGTYVLRLTAESGALRKSDDVTISVNGSGSSKYTLAVNRIGSGIVDSNPFGGVFPAGTVVLLAATPATGFQFSGWSGDLISPDNPTTITMNGNKTLTATFTALPPPQHTLTVNKVGSGSVAINPANASGVYDKNTVVKLTAIPAAGFQFSSWGGFLNGSTNNPATITMDANKIVEARFTPLPPPKYNLTVNKFGSGSVTRNPSSAGGAYDHNTMVTLTATPDAGFQFSGWSGDLSGSNNTATIKMSAHKTVMATFTSLPGVVAYKQNRIGSASNSTKVTTSGSLTAVHNDLYLAAISMRPKIAVLSVTGLGLKWKLVKVKCAGRNTTAVEVWMAQGKPAGNDSVTATFMRAPNTATIAVSHYAKVAAVNPIGNIVAGNTNGMNMSGICSGGVDKNSFSFNLAAAVKGAVIYAAIARKAATYTPGSGYIKRATVQRDAGLNTSGIVVEDKVIVSPAPPGGIAVNGDFGEMVDWAVVALEIKPAANNSGTAPLAKQNEATAAALPNEFVLQQNYPNPFSASDVAGDPGTRIDFSVPQASPVTIKVYTINGEEVATLVDEHYAAGAHAVAFKPKNLPSGAYFYVMQAGEVRKVRQLMLVK